MTGDPANAKGSPPSVERSGATSLALLRSTCGRHLDAVAPLLSGLPLSALDLMTLDDLISLAGLTEDPDLVVVLAGLFAALGAGSVCLELTPAGVSPLEDPERRRAAVRHLAAFREKLAAGAYGGLVDASDALTGAPLVRVAGGSRHPDRLYFQRYYRHEGRLRERLEGFLAQGAAPLCEADRVEPLVVDLWRPERVIRLGTEGTPLAADPWQQQALRLILRRGFAVISGGPGTGKTSLMVNMLRLLTACGIDPGEIRLTAPTGRAAQRMGEALQRYIPGIEAPTADERRLLEIEPATVHRLLQYRRRLGGFRYHARHPLPARAVVVDEVSMIDAGMLDRLLQSLDPRRTRLILIGDKDQLPSVEAGAVFAELVPSSDAEGRSKNDGAGAEPADRLREHLVLLKNSYRSGRRLQELGKAVNQGRLPEMTTRTMAEALCLPPDSFAEVADPSVAGSDVPLAPLLAPWIDHCYADNQEGRFSYLDLAGALKGHGAADLPPDLLALLFEKLARVRILTIARRGPLGCSAINRMAMAYLSGRHQLAHDTLTGLFNGAPVLITRNDYVRQLFNGDVGVALVDAQGGLRVHVQRGGVFINAPIQAIGQWEPAFATTVHKSQGSEFDDVLLVFPGTSRHRLLSREIFYTGVTRARKRLLLLGTQEEMQAALGHRIRRSSGLLWPSESGPAA